VFDDFAHHPRPSGRRWAAGARGLSLRPAVGGVRVPDLGTRRADGFSRRPVRRGPSNPRTRRSSRPCFVPACLESAPVTDQLVRIWRQGPACGVSTSGDHILTSSPPKPGTAISWCVCRMAASRHPRKMLARLRANRLTVWAGTVGAHGRERPTLRRSRPTLNRAEIRLRSHPARDDVGVRLMMISVSCFFAFVCARTPAPTRGRSTQPGWPATTFVPSSSNEAGQQLVSPRAPDGRLTERFPEGREIGRSPSRKCCFTSTFKASDTSSS